MIFFNIIEFKSQLKPDHRLLCLDIGLVRIGCALSDKRRILATAYCVFNLKKQKFTTKLLKDIIESEQSYGIILGYPLQMDGIAGKSCAMVDKFITKYLAVLDQPIFLQDERLSSSAVNRYFREMELSRKQQVQLSDKAAACYILQSTLERLRD
jgi:putative Holliday junction resolvase